MWDIQVQCLGGKIWRRKWQPTPVLLPGKSRGQRSLVDYSPGACKELDTIEQLHLVQCRRPHSDCRVQKIPWRRDRLPIAVFLGFSVGSDSKESAYNAEDLALIPGLGRSPGGGRGNPLQCSCLENPHGQRNLVGYSPWGPKESKMTE